MVDFAVVPERTALLNIDLQNCFVAPIELQRVTCATPGFFFAQCLPSTKMIAKIASKMRFAAAI